MLGGQYETGWAELKAEPVSVFGEVKFRIEPSQHQWMYIHSDHIPCLFLLAVDPYIIAVDGRQHLMLDQKIKLATLIAVSAFESNKHDFEGLADFLRQFTLRTREAKNHGI